MTPFLPVDETAQERLGACIAGHCPPGAVLHLDGDLGAGKTTLVRGFIQGLGHAGRVKSPTYTLIEPYEVAGRRLYHLDLYRLADPEELEYLGLRDGLDGESIFLIEWPEKGGVLLPPADLCIVIDHLERGRRVTLVPLTSLGERLAAACADCAEP
ncbi:tRNA (adenosine(37)-N6)-threonylcarbamoyltransferase complex ATPase subunit type 1 TsaE [Endothiovibrio diazotrophicus]